MGIAKIFGGLLKAGHEEHRIGAKELMALLEEGDRVTLIDVRTPDEFKGGHIPRSISVPLGSLSGIEGFPFREKVVLCCASGRRSVMAREILSRMGVAAVDLKGGVKAWVKAGGKLSLD